MIFTHDYDSAATSAHGRFEAASSPDSAEVQGDLLQTLYFISLFVS